MSRRSRWTTGTARLVSLALVAGLLSAVGQVPAQAVGNSADVGSWAPAGTTNVAPTATVTAHSNQPAWPPSKLVDGNTGTGAANLWVANESGQNAGGWVNLALPQEAENISRIVIFPRGDSTFYGVYFPARYTVSLLDAQGETVWRRTVVHPNSSASASAIVKLPDVLDLVAPVSASTVRIDILDRHAREGYVLMFAEVAVFAGAPDVQESPNLALTASVSASSSYEVPGEAWAASFAQDGLAGNAMGWSTNPYNRIQDPATPAWLAYDLGCTASIDKLAVYPRVVASNLFPKDFRLQVSPDGSTWTTLTTVTGNGVTGETPVVFTPPSPVQARHVRLYIDTRNGPSQGVDGYLSQISEFAVHGTYEGGTCLTRKPALQLEPGQSDDSWFTSRGPVEAGMVFTSSDEGVASVAADGRITAVGEGSAVVTARVGQPARTVLEIGVDVQNDLKRIGEDMLVAAFWAPSPEHVTQEQFATMSEFGLDLIMGNDEHPTLEENYTMATLAARNGFSYLPMEQRLGCGAVKGRTAAEIEALVDDYANVPGVAGFLLCDEAMPPTDYATAFNTVREVAPTLYPHYNFCPWGACGVNETSVRSWLDATGGVRSDWSAPDYLMYDMYPLKASIDFNSWFGNLEEVRKLGLEYKIKTATYLQSVGFGGGTPSRRPTTPEIAWEANTSLAYGYKQLAYFTYWQPTNRSEVFTEAIMAADGTRSDRFDALKELNSQIHALGPTLMKLDARDIYLNGAARGQRPAPAALASPGADGTLPAGTFVAKADGAQDLLFSRLVDRESGESYLFVVNNAFSGTDPVATDVTLTFDSHIASLAEVSRTDGTESAVALDGHALPLNLAGGEGRLYRLVIPSVAGLEQVVGKAQALDAEDYTTSSWNLMVRQRDLAEGVLAAAQAGGANQTSIDEAAGALGTAMTALVGRGDPRALQALLAAAGPLLPRLADFTESSATALRSALATATTTNDQRSDSSQERVDAAASGLQRALSGLVVRSAEVNKAALQHVVAGARAMANATGGYTAGSWSVLQSRIADAVRVLDDPSATQAGVDAAVSELSAAMAGLELAPPRPVVTKVKLNQSQARLVKGGSLKLEEGVYYQGLHTSYGGLSTWKSSNPRIATVTSSGTVKAKKTGTVTITVSSNQTNASGRKLQASVKVTVVAKKPKAKVTKVTASVPKTLKVGQTVYVTGVYSSSKATGVKVSYKTSKRSVADVDPVGRIIAKGKGTATVTVKAGGKSRAYKVTVR